ncbi:hypothetical protein [Acidithiobacillus ferrivorans]|jgi:predicted GNAT family N-acyltransferase|uniref:hypothetical protein n=1 Tax=Acidithiobacillus ferrivorans TaxID=160808 RepID=UPI000AC5527E|nr:hypothetical protein [Acidithiobacillus ferrivorans]
MTKSPIHVSAFPEKTSKLSVEIARLIQEGTQEGRKKAQELLQNAIAERAKNKI